MQQRSNPGQGRPTPFPASLRPTWARTLVLLLACWMHVGPGSGSANATPAQEPAVSSRISAGVVKLGSEVVMAVTVENARSARILELPSVPGLEIGPVGAPIQRSIRYSDNGRRFETIYFEWRFPIQAQEEGEFEIPGTRFEVDGREIVGESTPLTVVVDLRGETLGFFNAEVSKSRVYEGEPIEVELHFGWDLAMGDSVDQCSLSLPWWGRLRGLVELEDDRRDPDARELTLGLNRNAKINVDEIPAIERDGRRFRHFRLRRRYLPSRSGELEFPTSFVAFRQVLERGRGSFLNPRPDRTETYYVQAKSFVVEVLPLPEEGQPFDYTGAVGALDARAVVDRRDVDAGDSIKLTVDWGGEGNFEFFDAPDLARMSRFEQFRVYGTTEQRSGGGRRVVYDLAPVSPEITEIPPVPLHVFDTESEGYRVLETDPIPIRVRALEGALDLEGGGNGESDGLDIRDIQSELGEGTAVEGPRTGRTAAIVLGLPLFAWVARRRIRRGLDPDAPSERRRRRALGRLRRDLADSEGAAAQLTALQGFLGARTRERPEAWVGREPRIAWGELRPDRPAPGVLDALSQTIEELEASAFGGQDQGLDPGRLEQLARELVGEGL